MQSRRLCLVALLLSPQLSACTSDDSGASGRFAQLAQEASDARELEFAHEVPVVEMTREEFAAQEAASADDVDPDELQLLSDTYGRLGFFPKGTNLRDVFAGSTAWVGGTYNSKTETITVIGYEADALIVHEFVHALQDQHFDLDAYEDVHTSDAYLARHAAVEGDAKLAEARFYLESQYDVDLDRIDWQKLAESSAKDSAEFLAESPYPVLFMAYPSFVYGAGLLFCAHNLTGVTPATPRATSPYPYAWSKEDQLFTDRPPETTQQILELDETARVEPVGLRAVPRFLSDEVETVDWDSLGLWYTYLLLYPLDGTGSLGDVRSLADRWRGDGVLFVRDVDTDAKGTVWASAWQDADAATQVQAALWQLYHAKAEAGDPRAGTSADGEPVWIELRGDRLVALKNVAPDIARVLAELAFSETPESKPMNAHVHRPLAAWVERQRRRLPGRRD